MVPQDTASTHLSGLAKRLVNDEILSENQAIEAYQYSKQNRIPFVTHLVQSGLTNSNNTSHRRHCSPSNNAFTLTG